MFLIGKLFLLLLKPLTWIIIIFLIGLLSKNPKRKKRLLLLGFLLFLFFSNPFIFRILAKQYEEKPVVLKENEKYEAGIVLGGFVSYKIKTKEAFFNQASDRFIETALLYTGPFLLISSAIHLQRAENLFIKQKLNVRSYPCDFITQNIANNFWEDYLLPSAFTMGDWDILIKEITGLLIYKIIGKA